MILVRNVFRLKFGKAKEAIALWKEGMELMRKGGFGSEHRLLTDLAGPAFYTLVFEVVYSSFGEMEQGPQDAAAAEEWGRVYQKIIPLVESGYREVFTIVE